MSDVEILQDLARDVCRCRSHKMKGNSFCRQCFASLPAEKRQALYKRFGQGYERAFKDALQFLGFGEQTGLFETQPAGIAE